MKVLFVSGEDYCALTFENQFKGRKVSDIIENLEQCEREFLEANAEYRDCCKFEVKDLNVDQNAFSEIASFFSDYDFRKTENAYSENTIIE